jgi:hypothetical protein
MLKDNVACDNVLHGNALVSDTYGLDFRGC